MALIMWVQSSWLTITIVTYDLWTKDSCTKNSYAKRWRFQGGSTNLLAKASHLIAVNPALLMRPDINWSKHVLHSGWLWMTSRPIFFKCVVRWLFMYSLTLWITLTPDWHYSFLHDSPHFTAVALNQGSPALLISSKSEFILSYWSQVTLETESLIRSLGRTLCRCVCVCVCVCVWYVCGVWVVYVHAWSGDENSLTCPFMPRSTCSTNCDQHYQPLSVATNSCLSYPCKGASECLLATFLTIIALFFCTTSITEGWSLHTSVCVFTFGFACGHVKVLVLSVTKVHTFEAHHTYHRLSELAVICL